jgi:putative flippase GtrA
VKSARKRRSTLTSTKALKQFQSFLLIGLIATAIQYLVLILLVRYFAVNAVFASALGFAISSIVNYELNRKFTFASSSSRTKTIHKFYVVAISGLAINSASMWLLINLAEFHYLFSQILTTLLVLVFNFSLNKFWTFTENGAKKT